MDAAVLKLTPLVKPKIRVEYCVLETVVKALFPYRRKYIKTGARSHSYLCCIGSYPGHLCSWGMSKYKNRQNLIILFTSIILSHNIATEDNACHNLRKFAGISMCNTFHHCCRLLFPNDPELVSELFRLSEVDYTLRAQQLSLEQFEQLCNAFIKLVAANSSSDCNLERNIADEIPNHNSYS